MDIFSLTIFGHLNLYSMLKSDGKVGMTCRKGPQVGLRAAAARPEPLDMVELLGCPIFSTFNRHKQ